MRTSIVIFSVILLIILGALALRYVSQRELPKKEVTIHGTTFKADIADSEFSRMQGLSGRKNLGEQDGMLFIFQIPAQYTFWMKGMNFPLDFVWISNGFVIQVTENVPKSTSTLDFATYSPSSPVDQVLEINAGAVFKYGIQVGDPVEVK